MANQSQDGGKLRVIGKSNQKDLDYSSREWDGKIITVRATQLAILYVKQLAVNPVHHVFIPLGEIHDFL
jgi:hypothetical protein